MLRAVVQLGKDEGSLLPRSGSWVRQRLTGRVGGACATHSGAPPIRLMSAFTDCLNPQLPLPHKQHAGKLFQIQNTVRMS